MLSNYDDIPENPYILSPRHRNLQVQINRPELMKCTEIISRQQHKKPAWSDVQQVTKALMKLDIFNTRLVRQNINPKIIVERLIPFLNYEVFYATTPIIHYGEEATKLYVVCQGSAKEFIGKSNYEIQKEAREQEKKQATLQPILPLHSSVVSEEPDSSPESCKKSPGRRTLKKGFHKSKNSHTSTLENQKAFVDSVLRKSSKFATALNHLKTVIALNGISSHSKPNTNEKTFRRGALKGINAGDYEPEPTDYNFDGFREKRDRYYQGTVLKVKPSRTFNEGQYFGFKITEQATETKPTAMAAWTDCYCLTVEGEDLLRVIEEEKSISAYKVELFNEIFPDHTKQAIINFSYFWKERNFTHNEPIFEQGDPSDCIYTLVSGEITFSKTVALPPKEPGQREEPTSAKIKSSNPKTTIIKVAKVCDGSFFGEEDFFLDQARTLTATVTSTRAKVLQLEKKFYTQMLANHQDMFEKIMNLSETKYNYNIERLENLNSITTNGIKEDKAQEYLHLKDDMQISLQRPADPLPKIEGSSPKLKVYRHNKKQLSTHTNYKNIMNEIHEEHPLLVNFLSDKKKNKHSLSKDRSQTTEECESATISSARLPYKLSNTEPNEPRSWLPSFRRADKKGLMVPKSGSLTRETKPSHQERDPYDPFIVFNSSYIRTQTDTSISQQSPLLAKFTPIQAKISQPVSERSPLLSTKYKNINVEIRKCMKKLNANAIKISPRPSSKGKLEPIFINTGKTPASVGNITERGKGDTLKLIDSLKKIPLYTSGNDYIATTATSLTQSFRPFQEKSIAIQTLDDDDDDEDEHANQVEIVDDVSDDLFNFVTRKPRPKLKKLEIKRLS